MRLGLLLWSNPQSITLSILGYDNLFNKILYMHHNQTFRLRHQLSATLYSSVASRTNFFPIDEKSMQKNPRLRPVLLKEQARPICASRTGQGRF